ncbi:MAG: terminase small subunit [Verrucomicrobiales bacterium]
MKASDQDEQAGEAEDFGVNDRQRRFAMWVVMGVPAGRAYERAGYSARGGAADASASKLLRNAKVSRYVAKLRREGEARAAMGFDGMAAYLQEVMLTPVSKLTPDHHLVEKFKESPAGIEIRMPDKLTAAKLLARMMGWDVPKGQEPEPGWSLEEAEEMLLHSSALYEQFREMMERVEKRKAA